MMLQKAIPLLPSLNLRATIDFYEMKLGCKGTNMGSYAVIKCGAAEIHFFLVMEALQFHPGTCIIYADNLEDLYASFAAKDMLYQTGQIKNMQFGRKEFSIRDNNGNIIRFSRAF